MDDKHPICPNLLISFFSKLNNMLFCDVLLFKIDFVYLFIDLILHNIYSYMD